LSEIENSLALMIGGEVNVLGVEVLGKLFVFTPAQMNFLLNLQKMKNVLASALSVDKTEEWAWAFLKSKKFRKFVALKMQQISVKNGMTVEWWYQFGKWVADGQKVSWQAACPNCQASWEMTEYEVEQYRTDELELTIECPGCKQANVRAEKITTEFKPSREQVVAWQELGQRLIPKIERVHHQFENSEIVFESGGKE